MDQRISEDYKKLLRLRLLLILFITIGPTLLILTIVYGILGATIPLPGFTTAAIILFGLFLALMILVYFLSAVYANKWFENFSFELQAEGIQINSGVITKSQKFIPYAKIQDLEIRSGFWDRRYGLSSILIETAGSSYSVRSKYPKPEGTIPGLKDPKPIADEIRSKMGKGPSSP